MLSAPAGKLGLVLMGRAVLGKSLVHFSVGGWGYVPSLSFDLRPDYGEGNEDNGDLPPKASCCTGALSAPTLQQAAADPRLCWRLLDTHTHTHTHTPVGTRQNNRTNPVLEQYTCLSLYPDSKTSSFKPNKL